MMSIPISRLQGETSGWEMWKSSETTLVNTYDEIFNKSLNRNNSTVILFTLQPLTLMKNIRMDN